MLIQRYILEGPEERMPGTTHALTIKRTKGDLFHMKVPTPSMERVNPGSPRTISVAKAREKPKTQLLEMVPEGMLEILRAQ